MRSNLLFGLAEVSDDVLSLAGSSTFDSVGFDRFFNVFLRPKIFTFIFYMFSISHTIFPPSPPPSPILPPKNTVKVPTNKSKTKIE